MFAANDPLAQQYFQAGEAAFKKGRYKQAIEEYEKAYAASPRPAFLFNIGQCYRNLRDYKRAIEYYARYLSEEPSAANRVSVEQLIREMQEKSRRPVNFTLAIVLSVLTAGATAITVAYVASKRSPSTV